MGGCGTTITRKCKELSHMLHQSITEAVSKAERQWEGTRGKASQESQLRQALNTLLEVLGASAANVSLASVNTTQVQACVAKWRAEDKSPSTINSRLSVLSVMGINTDGCWVKNKLPPKWWLRPEEQDRLITYLRAPQLPFLMAPLLADYIEFISYTGLRVEEALRLSWRDVTLKVTEADGMMHSQSGMRSLSEMDVPGTKTQRSRATLALGVLPSLLLLKRKEMAQGHELHVFPIKYDHLHEAWDKGRAFLGEQGNRMATLKALRRTAARHLTVNGMPTEMVRAYFRHSNIKTTMGYLALVGGYNVNEQRKFLS